MATEDKLLFEIFCLYLIVPKCIKYVKLLNILQSMDPSNLELSLINYNLQFTMQNLNSLYNSVPKYDTPFARIKFKQKFISKFANIKRVKKSIAMCTVHTNKKGCV